MVKFNAVLLKPKGAFREIPHASTLFGAIANSVSLLYGDLAVYELKEAFMKGARISSAFPYMGDTYYLPKPLTLELIDFKEDPAQGKRLKRASYLDLNNFEKALRLELDSLEVPNELPQVAVDIPRVVLDRVTQGSNLYFWKEIRFQEKGGIYFLYSGSEEVFEKYIKPAVRFLGDHGIGGKSTWGFGLFEPSFKYIRIKAPESPYAVTLSNALPTEKPVLWKLLKKGGWSFNNRKPKMTFISEGSIIKGDPGRFEELDIGLPFRVYVYGLTFPIPTLLPEGLE